MVVHTPLEVYNPTTTSSTCSTIPESNKMATASAAVIIPKSTNDKTIKKAQPLTADLEYSSMDQEYFLSTLPHNYEYHITGLE